ncbi:MAG: thioredoxin-dependent thiol peroxidase [Patescibacteria group bacterium UBA2103]
MDLLHKKAPKFTAIDQNEKEHSLEDYRGGWVLLYFYPKDNTPGCTVEGQVFEEYKKDFEKRNTVVLGVSPDSLESHKKFAEKFDLSFPLLVDEDRKIIDAYKVWGEKKFMGRVYQGVFRNSFLINPEGKIMKVYENVKPKLHAEEVLKDLDELQ